MGTLLVGAATDAGRVREHNEDMVRLSEPGSPEVTELGFLAAVADGMGGHERGEVASELAIETIFATYYQAEEPLENPDDVVAALKNAFKASNDRILTESIGSSGVSTMGTTLVAAVINGSNLTVANVGDSRAYLVRAETATQISKDHSLVADHVASGVITAEEARTSTYRNVITRALGHRPKVEVDIFELGLLPDDRVVLCSDGVHGHVEPEEVAEIVLAEPPQVASQQLIDLALEHGSTDNVTAAILWYEPAIVPTDEEAEEETGRRVPVMVVLLIALVIALLIFGVVYFFVLP